MRHRHKSGFLPEDSFYPMKGLDVQSPSSMADPHSSPTCKNVLVTKGHVQKRVGYSQIGAAVTGTPIEMINFTASNGTEYLVLITTSRMYKLTPPTTWTDISPKANKVVCTATKTGTVANGTVVTQLVSGATATVVSYVGSTLTLDLIQGVFAGTDHIEKDGSNYFVPTSAFTVTANGGTLSYWTGAETDIVDWCVASGDQGTWLLVTNGKDGICYWDGSLTNFTYLRQHASFVYPDSTALNTCKTIASFNNHLVLGAPTVSTVAYPFSLVWSTAESLVDFSTGTSGEMVVSGLKGGIVKLRGLKDRLAVYSVDGVGLLTYVGDPAIFVFEFLVNETRLLNARSIVDLKDLHLFGGKENFELFDGTPQLRPIGDSVQLEYKDRVQTSLKERAFGFWDRPDNTIYFATPVESTQTDMYLFEYDPNNPSMGRWSLLVFAEGRPTCLGFYSTQTDFTCDLFTTVACNTIVLHCDEGAGKKGFPLLHLALSNGKVMKFDRFSTSDNGVAIEGIYDTIDFAIPVEYLSELGRWLEIQFEARGVGDLDVSYSPDLGANFIAIETETLSTSWTKFTLKIDYVSPTIRVRFVGLDTYSIPNQFEVRWVRVWVKGAGPR